MSIKRRIRETKIGIMIWPYLKKVKLDCQSCIKRVNIRKMVKKASKADHHIFYCGVCESSNMGDMAQTYCTLNWFSRAYTGYQVLICNTSVFRDEKCDLIGAMKKTIKEDDLIVFQSGYNTHDLGDGREDLMHQKVIQSFPNTEIIMLPQTVYFNSEDRKNQCSRVYNSHKKMLFFARDPISEKLASEMFPDLTVKLYPDIVTSLIGYYESNNNRHGIYLCRRNDIEQYYTEEEYDSIIKSLKNNNNEIVVSDTIIAATNRDIFSNLGKYVNDIISYFGKFQIVITDKYHGLIFSLISNTPVIVLKTKDHKVTSGYQWFSQIYPDRVFYADSAGEVEPLCKEILTNAHYNKLDNFFDREYYMKLDDVIKEWENKLDKKTP